MDVSGSSSSVFALTDATGSNAVECERVNFEDCTSLGYLDGYRQGLLTNWAFFGCSDGLELRSEWAGGFRAATGIIRTSTGVMFKAGSGLLFNSRFRTDVNADIPSGSNFSDFAASNFASDNLLEVVGVIFSGDGTPFPNIDQTNIKSLWRNNLGVGNTFRGGRWSCASETETTITTSGTYVKLAGTTTYTDLQHFSNTTDNAFVFDEQETTVDFMLSGAIAISGNGGEVVRIRPRVWDSSASAYIDKNFFQAKISSGAAGTRTETVPISEIVTLEQNDRVELWVSNETNTNNLTLDLGGVIILSQRN